MPIKENGALRSLMRRVEIALFGRARTALCLPQGWGFAKMSQGCPNLRPGRALALEARKALRMAKPDTPTNPTIGSVLGGRNGVVAKGVVTPTEKPEQKTCV